MAAWPFAAMAQQAKMPVVGYLSPSVFDDAAANYLRAFRQASRRAVAMSRGKTSRSNIAGAKTGPIDCRRSQPTSFAGAST